MTMLREEEEEEEEGEAHWSTSLKTKRSTEWFRAAVRTTLVFRTCLVRKLDGTSAILLL